MQPHLKKCFEGIAKLVFTEDKRIEPMQSAEEVKFVNQIITADVGGLVEKWLWEVQVLMLGLYSIKKL